MIDLPADKDVVTQASRLPGLSLAGRLIMDSYMCTRAMCYGRNKMSHIRREELTDDRSAFTPLFEHMEVCI